MSQDIVELLLRSDAAQLLRMSEAVKFGEDLSVRVTAPDLLIVSMVEGADEIGRLQALVQSMREALENIRELNFSGADENGKQWANSDLIDQEITAALSLGAKQ